MNKVYRSIYNKSLGAWIAVSELTKGHAKSSAHGASIATLATVLLAGASGAQAACPADTGGIFQVSTGETCAAATTSYSAAISSNSILRAGGAGSTVNLTASGVTITNTSSGNGWGVTTDAGGTINAAGNLTVATNGFNGRGIYMTGGNINVAGNLIANHLVRSQGAGVEVAGGVLDVQGTTTITTAAADGLRNSDSAHFGSNVVINASNYTQGVLNTGTSSFGSNLTITTTNMNAGINMISGTLSVARDLSITANNASVYTGMGVTQTSGALSVFGNVLISTAKSNGHGINIAGGSFEAQGGGNSISTQGAGADGIHATGGVVALGTTAAGVPLNTTAVLLESGNVTATGGNGVYILTTSGDLLARVGAAATVNGGNANGIYAANYGTGTTTINSTGTITGGSGAGISTMENVGTAVAINLNNGANVSATSGVAIKDDGGQATLMMASGSKLAGQVLMGNGNDEMIIKGTADIGGATLLDGGNGTDSTVTDILGTAGAATNKLSFQSTTQSLAGSLMKNWQTVTVDHSTLNFTGDAALVAGTGSNSDGSLQGLVLTNGATVNSPIALAVTGDTAIDATSTLNHSLGGSITGNVSNAGLIYWQNLNQTLTINGNYTGVAGSKLSLETYLGGDSSATDKLHVTGNTSGSTAITVRPVAGSPGAQTVNGINIVQVDGTSAAGSFTLAAPVQAGAYQYVLKQGSAVDANDWYLNSTYNCALNNSCSVTPDTPIYRPGVANYVSGQTANAEQGFHQLSALHQRMGEQKSVNADGRQTWLRAYHTTQDNDGETQFGYKQRITGFQIGQEILARGLGDGGTERAAIAIDYANSYAKFTDRMRTLANLSTDTGHMDAQSVALGGYYTRMDKDGCYVDLVGQVSSLRNVFHDSYGGQATQKGWRAALSGEVGRPVAQLGDWKIEPQAQLIYQYTNYQGFSDSISSISGYSATTLRGRMGVRIFDNVKTAAQKEIVYYGVANVIHDFNKPEAVTIGTTTVSERFDRTYGELGLGAQGWVAKSTYLYADARYQKSFGGHKDGSQFNLGLKIEF